MGATEYEGSNYSFSIGETSTDVQGRWRLDVAPRTPPVSGCSRKVLGIDRVPVRASHRSAATA